MRLELEHLRLSTEFAGVAVNGGPSSLAALVLAVLACRPRLPTLRLLHRGWSRRDQQLRVTSPLEEGPLLLGRGGSRRLRAPKRPSAGYVRDLRDEIHASSSPRERLKALRGAR